MSQCAFPNAIYSAYINKEFWNLNLVFKNDIVGSSPVNDDNSTKLNKHSIMRL